MKQQLLFYFIAILSLNCFSQISFENGYYIDNNNQKINCLIKNIDWVNNPTEFDYKLEENSEFEKATIKSIKEFGINNISKFIRSTVNIDRSSESINNLSNDKNPTFQEETLFLKVLVDSKASLYQYVDGNLKLYFYKNENTNIEQLIFKMYNTLENKIGKNNSFRQQLWVDLKCPNFKMSKIENVEYKKNDLVRFFTEYNECNNNELINYEVKQKKDLFNLTIRPRVNNSSLIVQSTSASYPDINFESEIGFGLGLEAEFILPYNKNKWSLTIEPTYQNFKSESTTKADNVSGGVIIANVDYSSIEIPLGLRHYFFLNDTSKIFINASYVLDFNSKSSIQFSRNDGSNLISLEINSKNNIAMGIGYKQNDKYSFEIKYQTNRNISGNLLFWNSEFKTFSIIFGYNFL